MELAFADCVLNLDSRQLFRAGLPVPLEPKAFQLLEVLAKRRPAVVTYIELDELLWPQAYVARTSLARIVSRRHARITVALGVATVDDLGSTNGTFINGVAVIAPTALKDGDEIALGKAVLTLHAVPGPAATEMITRDDAAAAPARAGVKP
jgi:hypothetical protein